MVDYQGLTCPSSGRGANVGQEDALDGVKDTQLLNRMVKESWSILIWKQRKEECRRKRDELVRRFRLVTFVIISNQL